MSAPVGERRRGVRRWRSLARAVRAELRRVEREADLRERFASARLEDGVHVVSPHLLTLGDGVLIQRGTLLHCGGLAWSDGRGRIAIGPASTLSHGCVLYGAGTIELGARFGAGPGCMLFSSRDALDGPGHVFAPIVAGDDVLLFAGCTVGPGVTLGEGCVVGAGSVVLRDVPPFELWAGSPARRIRALPQRAAAARVPAAGR